MAGEISEMKACIVVGSSGQIANWIINALEKLNIAVIKISRSIVDSEIQISAYENYDNMLSVVTNAYGSSLLISSIYYCPGVISLSPIDASTPLAWNNEFSVNLIGAYNCYRAIAEVTRMTKQASKLIFLGSTACISKPPMLSSYSVSKAALESLVTSINNEPPSHIRASCARIGTCKTSFSGSIETENVILEEDIVNFVHYIENSRLLVLPDLVSIRPIRYNLPN